MLNPYAAPIIVDDRVEPAPSGTIYIDGKYLVVTSPVTLPARCLYTNLPIEQCRMRHEVLIWAPFFRFMLFAKKCEVTYWQKRTSIVVYFLIAIVVLPIVIMIAYASPGLICPLMFLIFTVAAIVDAVKKRFWLRISRFEDGRYWLAGISEPYLQSCRDVDRILDFDPAPN